MLTEGINIWVFRQGFTAQFILLEDKGIPGIIESGSVEKQPLAKRMDTFLQKLVEHAIS